MSNMSYCRFTNTSGDLSECLDVIRQERSLSDFEAGAGKSMFKAFLRFCRDYDIIDGYDAEMVDALFNGLQKKVGDDE